MSLVKNKSGTEICFEVAETHMFDDLREYLHRFGFQTKQAFFSAYETVYEKEFGEPWFLSLPNPIY